MVLRVREGTKQSVGYFGTMCRNNVLRWAHNVIASIPSPSGLEKHAESFFDKVPLVLQVSGSVEILEGEYDVDTGPVFEKYVYLWYRCEDRFYFFDVVFCVVRAVACTFVLKDE